MSILLQMDARPSVLNPRKYPVEIIRELEDLLMSGGSALPDPNRKGFFDLDNGDRTFFIHISPVNGTVMLLAAWARSSQDVSQFVICGSEQYS